MNLIIPAKREPVTIDMAKTALIVVDMQNAFCKKGGMFDSIGMFDQAKVQPVIDTDQKVIGAARSAGLKIIYLQMGYRPDLADAGGPDSPNYWKEGSLVGMRAHPEMKNKVLTVGSWDWQIIDELKPRPGDILVNKNRYSGFVGTRLEDELNDHDLKYLLFVGLFTNVCVESTIRDAYFAEYFPVLVADACTNCGPDYNQDASVWNIANIFGWVTTTGDLIKCLSSIHLH
jgi:ureidoacrylate peracid hydrolase